MCAVYLPDGSFQYPRPMMANDSHTGWYPAAVEIYYSVCRPYCAFFAQNAVIIEI